MGCGGGAPTPTDAATALAQTVTIYRDGYGVPYIYGPTDASAVFGFAYAQAEDNFAQIEESYIHALGWSAEVYGESGVPQDWLNRALEVTSLSRAEYGRLSTVARQICDAFAAGVNYFLRTHTDVKPRLITHFENWHVLALLRYRRHQREAVEMSSGLLPSELQALGSASSAGGSNGLAVAPSKSATGGAMLIAAPHRSLYGSDQFYEGHLRSDEGWRLWGMTFVGLPFPHIGFTEHVAWTHTVNNPDIADLYAETFDRPRAPLEYRYNNHHRVARSWTEDIRIRSGNSVTTRRMEFRRTHHGPLVALRNGTSLALRVSKLDEGGMLEQWYAMSRAKSLDEFRAALTRVSLPYLNTIYADAAGNIMYVYGGAIPRRSTAFDWSKPVDGSIEATEWQGYHRLDDLPQVLNPPEGFVQNCNSSPFTTTSEPNPLPRNYPPYMVGPYDFDTPRAIVARRVLSTTGRFTFDDWQEIVFDSTVLAAEQEIPKIAAEWRRLGQESADREALQPLVQELEQWDGRSRVDSIAATVFFTWDEEFQEFGKLREPRAALPHVRALMRAKRRLERTHGSWRIRWGEINRLQRAREDDPLSDDRPSLPLAGGPGHTGVLFSMYSKSERGQKRRYAVDGQSFALAIAFGARLRAASVHVFGQSGQRGSGHYFDQAALVSAETMKPVWTTLEEIQANAVRVYRPGAIGQGQ
jgi:penicillin amidase